jgi:thiol-disulfide isomerase/thioredoxin
MRYTFLGILFVLVSVYTGYGQKKLVITPDFPQAGQKITIQYNPGAPGATISDTVSHIEMIFTYSNFYEMPWKWPLSKVNGQWQTSFTLPRYGVRATFYLQSGDQKDQPAGNKHYEIVVYKKNGKKVKNSYLYEGYSLSAQSGKSAGIAERQAALYEEELKNYPDNYEAKLRLLAYKIAKADGKDKASFRRKAEDIIAAKFREKPGNMGYMNLTTMGYIIIGENSRLDSIRKVVKEKYPTSEAGYELIIGDLKDDPDTSKMVNGLLALLKKENSQNAAYLKDAHEILFEYYAGKKQTAKALYHLEKTGKNTTPYQPETLKKQAEVLYKNGIALSKSMELAKSSLALADTFPIGIIRYFPETGFMPSYADRKTRQESTQKAKGNLYSLMALIAMKQGLNSEAAQLMKKSLGFSKDAETLSNAGNYYQQKSDFQQAFNTYYSIAAGHPEDTIALAKMKTNYISWKKNESGLDEQLQQLKNHWKEEMKSELQKQMIHILSPDFLSNIIDLKGSPVSPSFFKNKIVVLDFWATWCIPCMHEMPYLQKVYENYKNDSNVVFMVINSGAKNTLDDAKGWWGNKKFSFPVYYNTDKDIGDKLGFNLIPATFIIDANNYIRFKTVGFEGPVIERKIPAAIEILQIGNTLSDHQ